MPTTFFSANPVVFNARYAITSSGLVTMMMMEFGAYAATFSETDLIIFALVFSRSSRDIPGRLAIPAVMTTMSESTIHEKSVQPRSSTS